MCSDELAGCSDLPCFFDIFGKFASFLGPVIYSVMAQLTGRSSMGVLGLAVLFIAGLVLLVVSKSHLEALEKQASAR